MTKPTNAVRRLAATVLIGLIAACGTSSPNSGARPALRPQPGTLAAKADAICAAARAKAAAVPAPATLGVNAATDAAYFDEVFPISDKETKDIEALVPPTDATANDWHAFVNAQVAANELLRTLKQKADAKDPSGLANLSKEQPAGQKVAEAAKRIHAKTCAGG